MAFDEVPGVEPVDPDYADLFRDGDAAPSVSTPDAPDLPAPSEPPAVPPVDSAVDTGRLFRSQGVRDHEAAVLALSSDHGGRLRTLGRTVADVAPPAVPSADLDAKAQGPVRPVRPTRPPGEADEPGESDGPVEPARGPVVRSRGIRARAVYILVLGVTLLIGFINALVASGHIGWPTGVAMLGATVYCALKVRREDDLVVVISPPIAFGLVAITAAQLFLGSAERSLINRAVVAFFTLADNWVWIIGATLAALVIVLVRRRR